MRRNLASHMIVNAFAMGGPQTIRKIEVNGLSREATKRTNKSSVSETPSKSYVAQGVSQTELKKPHRQTSFHVLDLSVSEAVGS